MWPFEGESEAAAAGLVDRVLFLSEIQQESFADMYKGVPQAIIRNYVYPGDFSYISRANQTFCIGRLSRPDPVKYPFDVPVFYEELSIKDVRYHCPLLG